MDELDSYLNQHLRGIDRNSVNESKWSDRAFSERNKLLNPVLSNIDLQEEGNTKLQQIIYKLHQFKRIRRKLTEEILNFDSELDSVEDVPSNYETLLFGEGASDDEDDEGLDMRVLPGRGKISFSIQPLLREISYLCSGDSFSDYSTRPERKVQNENERSVITATDLPHLPTTPERYVHDVDRLVSPKPSTPKFNPLFS
jgi:hypothetical protein|eukprot:gene3650-3900_t